MDESERQRIRRSVPAGLLVGITVAALQLFGALEPLEVAVYDRLFEWRGPRPPRTPIVIVSIDESSFVELRQQWPFPRALHAEVISRLAEGKPLAIGVDLIFDVPSGRGPADDEALGDAVRLAGNVVLAAAPKVEVQDFVRREVPNVPVPVIRMHAAAVAATNSIPEEDAAIRRFPISVPIAQRPAPSFDVALYQVVAKAGLPVKPLPASREYLINFRGWPRTFKWVPYYRVLRGEVPPSLFKGTIVLVGATTNLLHDVFPTPFARGGDMPGVEIHANALETLVLGDRIRDTGNVVAALLALACATFVAGVVAWMPRRAPTSAAALLVATWAVACAAFALLDVWLRVAGPTLAIVLGLLAAIVGATARPRTRIG
ncbi:MAG: CHASE2 domain-containing protein [Candidatus Rokuibacteriota bacterium]